MKTGFTKSSVAFSRALELTGGTGVALLGLFLFARIISEALSLGEPIKPVLDLKVFLILALPGIVVATGSYLQTLRRIHWMAMVVLIGGITNFVLVGFNVGLAYALIQDRWGRVGILASCIVTVLTMGMALVNVLLAVVLETVEKPRQYG